MSYMQHMLKKKQNQHKEITEKEFLESEKREQILENLEKEHEEDKNSN